MNEPKEPTSLQSGCRAAIKQASTTIESQYASVRELAKMYIEDFHWMDYDVSLFWTCNESPIGMCVFKLDDYGRKTHCRYCRGPTERK